MTDYKQKFRTDTTSGKRIVAAVFACFVFFYFAIAFVNWELNAQNWSSEVRLVYALLSSGIGAILAGAIYETSGLTRSCKEIEKSIER